MSRLNQTPQHVEFGFAKDGLTGTGGHAAFMGEADRLGLPDALSVKQRRRGPTDAETVWAPTANFGSGGHRLFGATEESPR